MAGMLPVAADVKCEPVNAGGVKAEWVTAPGADADRAVLYLHGGGYVIGSINTHRDLTGRISRGAKARVLGINYRLAPEHPFPAAVDDAVAAYRWMLAQGIKPSRIAAAGRFGRRRTDGGGAGRDSRRQAGDARRAGVCMSPWVDLEGHRRVDEDQGRPPIRWCRRTRCWSMAKLYLDGKDPRTPLAAPLYADLAGLPPLLIQVGTAETLMDDATRLAERARKAGVKVTLEPWENMIHVFQVFAPMLDEGQQAIEKIGEFVRANAA